MKFYIAESETYDRLGGHVFNQVHEIRLRDVGTPGGSKEGKALWSFVKAGEKEAKELCFKRGLSFFPFSVANEKTATTRNLPVVRHKDLWSFFKHIDFNPRIPNVRRLVKRPDRA